MSRGLALLRSLHYKASYDGAGAACVSFQVALGLSWQHSGATEKSLQPYPALSARPACLDQLYAGARAAGAAQRASNLHRRRVSRYHSWLRAVRAC